MSSKQWNISNFTIPYFDSLSTESVIFWISIKIIWPITSIFPVRRNFTSHYSLNLFSIVCGLSAPLFPTKVKEKIINQRFFQNIKMTAQKNLDFGIPIVRSKLKYSFMNYLFIHKIWQFLLKSILNEEICSKIFQSWGLYWNGVFKKRGFTITYTRECF